MTTYDDPEPDHPAPAWLVWTLRVAALLIVTPLQLLGVARRLLLVALLTLAREVRRALGQVGRALAPCWSVVARGLRAVGRGVAAALRGMGTGIVLLVRAVAWVLRRLDAAVDATGPFWRALGRVVSRATAATLPVWRLVGFLALALGRAARPVAAWLVRKIFLLVRLVAAALRAAAVLVRTALRAVLVSLGWAFRQVCRPVTWCGRAMATVCRLLWSGLVTVTRALAGPLGALFSLARDALGWAASRSWWVLCRLARGIVLIHGATLRPVLRALGRLAHVTGSAIRRSTAPLRRAAAEARASLRVAAASVRRALR